jgi:transcriptional regulator with XRE-family HTH domain
MFKIAWKIKGALKSVDDTFRSLRGDLIQWSREQQRLTMRWVAEHGGPCLGYQSEVENGKKVEVRSDKLGRWTKLLNVTEPFVRGLVPRYTDDPDACRGLAADVGKLVGSRPVNWPALSSLERARRVLCLVSQESRQLPRVVLAHVLTLEVQTLDAYLSGELPLAKRLVEVLGDLTTLPENFFKYGVLEQPDDDYQAALEAARARGISPDALLRLIEQSGAPKNDPLS